MRFLLTLAAIYRHPLNRGKRREFRRNQIEPEPRSARKAPEAIVEQIKQQARHDPAILAPGPEALAHLLQFCAADLWERDEVDATRLFGALRNRPRTLLVVPWLTIGGAETYSADLLDALLALGAGPALVVATQQTAIEASGWENFARLAPFRAATVLFWRDFCGPSGASSAVMFGRFLNALRAERIIVVNSRVGLEAVAMFGRGLSQNAGLFCAYFSLDPKGYAHVYGARFPRRTTPFALTLTDNEPMAETMRRLHGSQPGPGVAVLPPRLPDVAENVFLERLDARRKRAGGVQSAPHWVWVSRIEPAKGIEILRLTAILRPNHMFDLFGPVQGAPPEQGLGMPNLRYRGVLPDVLNGDFASYDGFLFTSLFEGMPNVVLEMSQHAIPMILADVGGLRETFGDSVRFVRRQADPLETASLFAGALDEVASMDVPETLQMVSAAREQALARHAPAVHAHAVGKIFGVP